jgi:hypothetical protein
LPIEGCSETASPLKVICHCAGLNGVTTSSPQPQQHRCAAVAYSLKIEAQTE